ncbi:SDR family oxidoreductase [Streptomyces sp. NPDC020983]|uniref:SDR family oxidoreductase n=1 Tax=Streptomyces sp. NPDC020983 TaxID=3365106 RepID=UPI0037A0B82E
MEQGVRGRAAVVTGGSRGIGRAVVERLCADGAEVVFGYLRDERAAAEVTAAAGGRAHAVRVDLADPDGPEELMRTAEERLGGLDILVNNAALSHRPTTLAETGDDLFDEVFAVNTRAVFLTLRYAARRMRDGGRIVTVSSVNTARAARGIGAYAASKGAIEQLTAVAAQELGPRGITANTVSPGATDTDLLRSVNPAEALEAVAGITPLGRLGLPSDIAAVVAFLTGPDGRWVTGQNLRATGGLA